MEATEPAKSARKLVFIGHANPEQNAMTLWLSSRLMAEGYETWADVEKLDGGDPFWSHIETALRDQSAKYLLLASKLSVSRGGVLNELAVAASAGKRLNDPSFIIPLRADNIAWDDMPIQVSRNNGIDFSKDWAAGLAQLLATLERDRVPRSSGPSHVARVTQLSGQVARLLSPEPDSALLCVVPLLALPPTIHRTFAENASETELRSARKEVRVPCEPHGRLLVSFATSDEVIAAAPANLALQPRHSEQLSTFLSGGEARGPGIRRGQAWNFLTSLIRQSLEDFFRARGLRQHDYTTWYVPTEWTPGNKATYRRTDGTPAARVLLGKAKQHTWHFAVRISVLPRDGQVRIAPHVVFSANGETPYPDQKQLRRRHCKLWWNDNWRDRLQAFLAALVGADCEEFSVPCGGSAAITLGARLLRVELPMSYRDADAYIPDEDDVFDTFDAEAEEAPANDS